MLVHLRWTRVPSAQGEAKPLEAENAAAFQAAMKTFGFDPAHVVPHGS